MPKISEMLGQKNRVSYWKNISSKAILVGAGFFGWTDFFG
jgi:hypothetical protein